MRRERRLLRRLGGSYAGSPDLAGLHRIFSWFLDLDLPYETLSNLGAGILVKTPGEVVATVAAGFGGHCVEHAALFAELLREAGFDARYANADVTVPRPGGPGELTNELAKPLVLVRVGRQRVVCDPYYTRMIVPAPDEAGECAARDVTVRRTGPASFQIRHHRGGRLRSVDTVHEDSGLDDRVALFRRRYADFSPWGVTAPYVQRMRPVRQAVYYDPEADALVSHTGRAVTRPSTVDGPACEWIPPRFRARVAQLLERSRAERHAAARFLRAGGYVPHYRLLLAASSAPERA